MNHLAQPDQTPVISPIPDSTVKIGRIVAVTGAHAIILLEKDDALPDDKQKSPEISTLLKVDTEPSVALALISSLSTPTPGGQADGEDLRIVEVEFIGELPKDRNGNPGNFRRGISCYPALGDVVARASRQELAMAYASDSNNAVRVGHIKQDSSIPAMVKTDELLGKHFAVLGTTGTGKSCAVALILRRILEENPLAHILLLDVHREYASAFKDFGEIVTPANLVLPFWLLNFEEISEIVIAGQKNREADIEILRELIPMAKQRYKGGRTGDKTTRLRSKDGDDGTVGVDTPIPYRISDIVGLLDEALGKLELKGELAPYKRLKARFEQISRDARYSFMFGSLTVHDSMAEIIGHLFRIPVNDKPITILELGGLPSEIINVVVSVLARMAFDFGLWSGGQVPITFVCEEAHRYVPYDETLGFEPTKRAISKIAKEGRKYGVSLCIVSQRPAELDPTILSQCSTVFSMRLTNERDQELLRAGISDAAASLLEFMPTMGTGEAIAFGEGVSLPTRVKFDLLPPDCLPKSNTASFTTNWNRDVSDPTFLDNIVACWRQQTQITEIGFSTPAKKTDIAIKQPSRADRREINTAALNPTTQPSIGAGNGLAQAVQQSIPAQGGAIQHRSPAPTLPVPPPAPQPIVQPLNVAIHRQPELGNANPAVNSPMEQQMRPVMQQAAIASGASGQVRPVHAQQPQAAAIPQNPQLSPTTAVNNTGSIAAPLPTGFGQATNIKEPNLAEVIGQDQN